MAVPARGLYHANDLCWARSAAHVGAACADARDQTATQMNEHRSPSYQLHVRCPSTHDLDRLGIEPRASRMLSGCDTTTPSAHLDIFESAVALYGAFIAPSPLPNARQLWWRRALYLFRDRGSSFRRSSMLLLVLPDGVHRYSAGLRHTWRQFARKGGGVVAARPHFHADLDTWVEAFGPNEPGQFQRGGRCYILLFSKGAPHSPGGDVRCISGDLQSLEVFMGLDELYSWAAPLPGKASCQLEMLQRLLQQS